MTWRRGMGRDTISQIGVGLVFLGVVWGQDGLQGALFGDLRAGFDGAETAVVMRVSRPFSTDVQVTVRVARGRAESVAVETVECLECVRWGGRRICGRSMRGWPGGRRGGWCGRCLLRRRELWWRRRSG